MINWRSCRTRKIFSGRWSKRSLKGGPKGNLNSRSYNACYVWSGPAQSCLIYPFGIGKVAAASSGVGAPKMKLLASSPFPGRMDPQPDV